MSLNYLFVFEGRLEMCNLVNCFVYNSISHGYSLKPNHKVISYGHRGFHASSPLTPLHRGLEGDMAFGRGAKKGRGAPCVCDNSSTNHGAK